MRLPRPTTRRLHGRSALIASVLALLMAWPATIAEQSSSRSAPGASSIQQLAERRTQPLVPIGGPFQPDAPAMGQLPTAPEAAVPDDWYAAITKDIAASEYHIRWQEEAGAYQSPNRKQDLRITYRADGFSLKPRVADSLWSVSLTLDRIGRMEQWYLPTDSASITAQDAHLLADHGAFTVEYLNTEEGMRQNFIVRERPAGEGPLELLLDYHGTLNAADKGGNAIAFCTPATNGTSYTPTLWYKDLHVWDAHGDTLEATATLMGDAIVLAVNDADATYPITVDPLSTTAAWTAESDQASAAFAYCVSSAGDVNGDGYADVIVGTPFYDNGQLSAGCVYLYFGSPSGLSNSVGWSYVGDQVGYMCGTSVGKAGDVNGDGYDDVIIGAGKPTWVSPNGTMSWFTNFFTSGRAMVFHGSPSGPNLTANWIMNGFPPGGSFGGSVRGAGDVNGDGYDDVIIGAHLESFGETEEGRAYVFHGGATGLSVLANWTSESNQTQARFGFSVDSAGDVNGDGYDDVIIGSISYDNGQLNEGRAFLFLGSASGLSSTPNWIAESDQATACFGNSVASAGDVNGDGYGDVVIGALSFDNGQANEGRAFVFHGSPTGLSSTPNWMTESDQVDAGYGSSVSSAGDINGDGFGDVIIGAIGWDNGQTNEGQALVFSGSSSGLSVAPTWAAESNQDDARFGNSVASAGDVNGDGYDDVIVGAPNYDNGETNEGRAYVYYGGPEPAIPDWSAESDQASAHFGTSVGSAGDVNGDGYSEVIIGAPDFDNGQTNEGRAYLFHGSATGPSATANWTFESDLASAQLGISVATAGDVNGDGFSDVVIGASGFANGQSNEGRIYVFHGSIAGLPATPAWTFESDVSLARLGFSVACAGDVNNDGYSDVIAGAYDLSNGQTNEGRAYVFHGTASGLPAVPSWTYESNQTSARLGRSVAGAGDVNGDGFSDVIIGVHNWDNGQTNEGRALVFHGSGAGLSAAPNWTEEIDLADAWFGYCVATAGDVNGDGYSDVIVGAYQYNNGLVAEGAAFVYQGSAAGLAATHAWMREGEQTSAHFGEAVACAGDVNGDGYADILVGAPDFDQTINAAGRVQLWLGSASGVRNVPFWISDGTNAVAGFGSSVASAGDVNGDGYSDFIIGAPGYTGGQAQEGNASVYLGAAEGLGLAAAWTAESNQSGAAFGFSVASAGDVNGDGYSDVIVGARLYDNGQIDEGRVNAYYGSATGLNSSASWTVESNQAGASFGWSTASAGDVNGDGYSDVIVGAVNFDNGEINEGRAYVFHGSATGLSATPNWTAESDQAYASYGYRVSSAGDVNGDGYSDVIVGAINFDNGQTDEGRAFVYHGSASGLSATPIWTAESDQVVAYFGSSVASAGDVNGDGYSDVIVGARDFDNGQADEGRTFVYHGSASGLSATPNWTAESDQAGASFGSSVSSAGDVNGDGYSDVIVGAYAFDNGQANEGRAYVYHGSASGLSATPNWTAESDQAYAYFGWSVHSAGDVNGDGYSDVIVGAPDFDNGQTNEGRAFVYHGSSTGLSTSASWTSEANQPLAYFGWSVSSAGDVNGDGYSDVIAGASDFDNGQANEGRAFLYHGNKATGRRNNLRLYNTNLTAPINASNIPNSQFGTGLYATPFLGRDRVRMVWETRYQGQAFSSAGGRITNSTAYTAQQTGNTLTATTGTEVKNLVDKLLIATPICTNKIRARIRYNRATAITGQVFGPWRYMPGYLDGQGTHNNVPLPVEMLWMEAACDKGTPLLTWATGSESSNAYFAIERSTDAETWERVGHVNSTGNSQQVTEYAWRDERPLFASVVYYRLRQVDLDGREEVLAVVPLASCTNGSTELNVMPNPTDGPIEVRWAALGKAGIAELRLVDMHGRTLRSERIQGDAARAEMDLAGIAAGTYTLLGLDAQGVQVGSARVVRR
ncbi:MAG: FG-GAP repeat protein [Flavobacteriales bacterium]|nr:FG-GAP repeat protein [Flavobacteriales bacterium]